MVLDFGSTRIGPASPTAYAKTAFGVQTAKEVSLTI